MLGAPVTEESSMKNFVRANKGFLMFLLLFGVFRSAVADWSPIPSGSMRPNLLEGDVVLINRMAFDLKIPLTEVSVAHLGEPARGDMVVFHSPHDGTRLIKRVLALPGDLVEMRGDRLFINGEGASYAPLGEARERSRGLEVGAIRLEEQVAGTPAHPGLAGRAGAAQLRSAADPARPVPDVGRQPQRQRRFARDRPGAAREAGRPRRADPGVGRLSGKLDAAPGPLRHVAA